MYERGGCQPFSWGNLDWIRSEHRGNPESFGVAPVLEPGQDEKWVSDLIAKDHSGETNAGAAPGLSRYTFL